ncbi:MAG TPA: serine/threonine-protein kinase, partial [Polyangiaceae bacterium]|nr:serine/threonine-protein kinase [Polyangiaceae bacterium]
MSAPSSAAQRPLPDPEEDSAAEAEAFGSLESTAIVGASGAGGTARYVEGSVVAQKYRLVRLLGEGGMGAVWVAQNLTLGVQVALKLIRAEIEGKVDGLSERLLTEARAAASIGHPAIIQVFDFGVTEHSEPYIAMELLKGESLSHVIKRRGRIAAGRAVRTLLPVIEGLCVANQRGIVHRDLKPDNIFLAQQANRVQPKLLDFGIAKLSQSFSANLTSEGTVLGSPAYMSPEQARGENDVDFRTDMWALCVVLYEMITGVHPFTGANWHGLMWAIMEGKPKPLSEHQIEEPALWAILQRGLSKEREQRYGSMFELGQMLAMWLIDQGVTRDICNTSLKTTWLERSPDSSAVMNSFFPSDAPGSSDANPGGPPLGDPTAPVGPGLLDQKPAAPEPNLAVDSKSRIRRSHDARRASAAPATSKAWLIVTALGALVSFSAAVAYSLSAAPKRHTAEDDEPLPNIVVRQPSKDLGIATRRDLLPNANPAPSMRLSDELDSLREARDVARSANVTKKPATKA